MKTGKKVLSILLTLLMLALCVPVAFAAGGTEGNINWNYDESTKTLTLSGSGEMTSYAMDDPPWFPYRGEATKIVIEDGITKIGSYAFYQFTALKTVNIPASVTIIGDSAFCECTKLKYVYYDGSEASWNSIWKGENVFACYDDEAGAFRPLESIVAFTSGVEGNLTWTYDKATKTLTLSGSGEMMSYAMDDPAWYPYHEEATKVVIEDGITKIGSYAFYECTALESVTIPSGVQRIGNGTFAYCTSLESVTIPSGVQSIGEAVFYECTSLESVTIPSSVQSIDHEAFANCTALKTVNYTGSEEDWNKIEKGQYIFTYEDAATGDILPIDYTINYNYVEPQPEPQPDPNMCHWCGKVHEGFFQKIIGFFHNILARIFGNKY